MNKNSRFVVYDKETKLLISVYDVIIHDGLVKFLVYKKDLGWVYEDSGYFEEFVDK